MNIRIETVENGFVVYEDCGTGMMGKKWAFETAKALSEFVLSWGKNNDNT